MSYWKCNDKYYICSEFIPDRDYVLRPLHFPYDKEYLLVPKGMCTPDCHEVTEADAIAHLAYNIEYDGTLQTAKDGTRALADVGNPPNDYGVVHSGNTYTLSGDGKVEVPINAELGSELYDYSTLAYLTMTPNVDGKTIDFDASSAGTVRQSGITIGSIYSIVVIVHSGHFSLLTSDWDIPSTLPLLKGTYNLSVKTIKNYAQIYAATAYGVGNIEIVSIKEIQAVKGSVIVFNEATKAFEQPTLPLSTTLTLKDGTYGVICKLHTNSFSSADLDEFTARPELMIEWKQDFATIPSGITFGANDKVYTFIGNDTLPITGTHTTSSTSEFGLQSIAVGSGAINGGNDGRRITLPLKTPHEYLVKDCIDKINGNTLAVTIQHCDGTKEIIKD